MITGKIVVNDYKPAPQRPEQPTTTEPVELTLPAAFYNAHVNLPHNLAAGELLKRHRTGTVRVRLDAEAWETLLESAQYCARNDYTSAALKKSARSTIRRLVHPSKPRPVEVKP